MKHDLWGVVSISAICLGLGGCGPSLSKPATELLIGTWAMQVEVDDNKLKNMLRKAGKTPEAISNATELGKSLTASMKYSLNLKADGTYEEISVMPNQRKKVTNGTWKISNEGTSVVTFKMSEKTGSETVTASFLNDDEFEYTTDTPLAEDLPLKTPLVFVKQK